MTINWRRTRMEYRENNERETNAKSRGGRAAEESSKR